MNYFDQKNREKYIPYIIESTYGLDRITLAILCESLTKQVDVNGAERTILKINSELAPIKVSILPLERKKHGDKAFKIYKDLRTKLMVYYDDKGNIGKRYRKSDAIGTPYSVCVDEETINNNTVTIRDRDTRDQFVISADNIEMFCVRNWLREDKDMKKIMVIAPSKSLSVISNDTKKNAINKLNSIGYEVIFSKNVYKNQLYYCCGSVDDRVEDLNEAFSSNVDVILAL